MRLYMSKTSPYSRKVRIAIIELNLGEQVEQIVADPFAPPSEMLAANPLSKIPTLITDRGEALPDSGLILDYLQTRAAGIAPLPRGSRRWAMLRIQRVAEGVIDAAVATVYEKRRPESIVYTQFVDRQAERIMRSLDLLNLEIGALNGDAPGVAEITVAVALEYIDFRLPYIEWRKSHAALADWLALFSQRPSMQQTAPSLA